MLVRHFDSFARRVPDPMRPGRTAAVVELRPSHVTSVQYQDTDGATVAAVPRGDGWFTVPHEAGVKLCRPRTAGGGGFFSDAEVDEKFRLGMIIEPVAPAPAPAKRKAPEVRRDAD